MKTYAQRMKKPQPANLQQSNVNNTHIGNLAMGAMMGYDISQSTGDPALEDKMRARLQTQFGSLTQHSHKEADGVPLPSTVQREYEEKSGLPMDDVRVHYNSENPSRFDAGAYTYGTNIFIGPGQEELLNHEMVHITQQKRGQVHSTGVKNGMPVNSSQLLERSADNGIVSSSTGISTKPVVQCGDFSLSNQGQGQPPIFNFNGNSIYDMRATVCHSFTSAALKSIARDNSSYRLVQNGLARQLINAVHQNVLYSNQNPNQAQNQATGILNRIRNYRNNRYNRSIPDSTAARGVYQNLINQLNANDQLNNYLVHNANPAQPAGAAMPAGQPIQNVQGPGILLFLDQGNRVQHSMIAQNANTWIGTNNGGTFGTAQAQHATIGRTLPPNGVSIYGNIHQRAANRGNFQGGWDQNGNFQNAMGEQMQVCLIPFH